MKEDTNIDELLNGYIDGELTARGKTEVERLIKHDLRISSRLEELQRTRDLVGCLPIAEAPAGLLGRIKASLERGAVVSQPPQRIGEVVGARHLLVRRFAAAAAMIGLIAVLAGLVYTIVAPEGDRGSSIALEGWKQPVEKVETGDVLPVVVATSEVPIVQPRLAAMEFNGKLELKTSALVAVDASMRRAFEDNGLLEKVDSRSRRNEHIYRLSCSKEALKLLLTDLEPIWSRLETGTLSVETDQFGGQVVVEDVDAGQISEIINQDSVEKGIEVARDFATLNSMAELLPGREVLSAIDDTKPDLLTIPKPVLTSSAKTMSKGKSRGEEVEDVHLTIVVAER
ncbi:MAG: anti-sigma factor family protein [Planctomycetota bacterium]|jgi:hypothetical protein